MCALPLYQFDMLLDCHSRKDRHLKNSAVLRFKQRWRCRGKVTDHSYMLSFYKFIFVFLACGSISFNFKGFGKALIMKLCNCCVWGEVGVGVSVYECVL